MSKRHSARSRTPRSLRRVVLTLVLAAGLLTTIFATAPQPAAALFGIGDISITVGDIPRRIEQFITAARQRVGDALKVAADIAFKNSLEVLNARIAQEVLTQISTSGPGQQPLFLTNPKTFFRNVADNAAGEFIDQYSRGLTQRRGPGAPTSSARQRFLISRILRTAVGSPLEQCRQDCTSAFGVTLVSPTGGDADSRQQNEHEFAVQTIYNHIVGFEGGQGTQRLADTDPGQIVRCRDVRPGNPTVGATYIPWVIVPGLCDTAATADECFEMTAQQCLARQREAINTERSKSQAELNDCLRKCREGGAALAETTVNRLTATDFFTSVNQLPPGEAANAVVQSLSIQQSDVGQLLLAYSQLNQTIQDKITGEQTNLQSGILPRTSKVSDVVLVPREAGQQSLATALLGGNDAKAVYTGTPGADIVKGIAAFLNSPVAKLLTNFFKSKCGLNPDACRGPSQPSSALGQLLFGSGGATGIAGARLQFAQIGKVEYLTGDPGRNEVDITNELSSSGLIDSQFRSAIEDQATVQEALTSGTLDGQKTFGFDKNGLQPFDGYPYRALQYLRKFRVTPVGWELAAQYSRQFDPRDLSLDFLTKHYNLCAQGPKVRQCSDNNETCVSNTDCNVGATCNDTDIFASNANQVCSNDISVACTQDSECSGGTCGASPYCGLVDPNWVLKAPQTYCRRQGAGEEIIAKEFVCDQNNVDSDSGKPIPAGANPGDFLDQGPPNCDERVSNHDIGRWIISRNANTCADTQSCIAENEDGTCIAFGYCVQERQIFKFDGTQCNAEFASCTTYTDTDGQQASYLANTLDFQNCNADVAGCQWYCSELDPTTSDWACAEPTADDDPSTTNNIIRFSDNVETCPAGQAGCRQFVRTVNGTNLLPNAGFEIFDGATIDSGSVANYPGWIKAGGLGTFPVTTDDPSVTGNNLAAVNVTGASSDRLSATVDTGYRLYERTFVGSIRARATSECTADLILTADAASFTESVTITPDWNSHSVSLSIPPEGVVTSNSNSLTFALQLNACGGAGLTIDSAQLEEGAQTQFKDYGTVNVVHLNNNRVICSSDDVGCEAYAPKAGGPVVTGQVRASNRCSADNVGCGTYFLEPFTTGPISRAGGFVNIVAPKGQICSAADVGCEEYTNLDVVAAGGEGREYFKSVKQCVKPDPAATNQVTYYSWVGDARRGFILRAHTLLQSDVDAGPCTHVRPGTAAGQVPTCEDGARGIAACSAADMATNPDCGEFYDAALRIFYRLRSQTVSVTAECRSYRNSVDQTDADPSNDNNIYFLSPRENVSCSSAVAGCRAYTGNNGRTARTIFSDNFESGTTSNWIGGLNVTESVNLGGHSMYIPTGGPGTAIAFTQPTVLQNTLVAGKYYVVSFLAAPATQTSDGLAIRAGFGTANGNTFDTVSALTFGSGTLRWNEGITPPGPEWQTYTLGPVLLTDRDYRLGIWVTGGEAFVDNVVLTEINDSLYLVSPTVPFCPASEVGCAAYTDRAGREQYLKSFSRICSEEVVGCEAMIDTQNSSNPFAQTVKNELTPDDQVVTVVHNRANYCSAAFKGCQAYGKPVFTIDRVVSDYQTVHLINDPDRHALDLCLQSELFCRAYTSSEGTAFFKDPSNRTCEFRRDASDAGGTWYISGTDIRCPTVTPPLQGRPIGASCSLTCASVIINNQEQSQRVGKACGDNADCPLTNGGNATCVGDASTIGKIRGGTGTVFGQCTDDSQCAGGNKCIYLAGTCPAGQNGCNEYRDPSDPPGCRVECPYLQQGGSPVYLDQQCQAATCSGGSADGQNCQTSAQCGGGQCLDSNGDAVTGVPGCRSYNYLRQTVEENASECNGEVDVATGCRPFNDTSKPTLNFRGL